MNIRLAIRSLRKHKFYTCINVLGLAVSMACAVILFQFISYHLSFDTHLKHGKQLYRVVTDLHLGDGSIEYGQGSPLVLATAIKASVPQVADQAVILKKRSFTVAIPQSGNQPDKLFAEHDNVALVDDSWLRLFELQLRSGETNGVLTAPNTAVISAQLAEKYFGQSDPLGRVIRLDQRHQVKITGVLEHSPRNSDFKADLYLSLASVKNIYPEIEKPLRTEWGFINSTTNILLVLPEGADPQDVTKAMMALGKKNYPADMASVYQFHLQPLANIHFNIPYGGAIQQSLLVTLGIIGLLLLLIAFVNFINMATAQSSKRGREIATRKILGSTPVAIFRQFITETACITGLATVFAVAAVWLFLPWLNSWLGIRLAFGLLHDPALLIFIIGLMALTVVAAGFYPALMLSRFRPITALKNQTGGHTTRVLTGKSLIVVQNVIAQVLIISTILITMQVRYMKNADMGYNKNAVLMVPIPGHERVKTDYLRNRLMASPAIKNVSFCFRAPSHTTAIGGSIKYDTREWEEFVARSTVGDSHYLQTFGLRLVAGRNLAESDTLREFLVNEELVKKLNVKDPLQVLGKRMEAGDWNKTGVIVGIVKDFHLHSFTEAIPPTLITAKRDAFEYAAIKCTGQNQQQTIAYIRQQWQALYPESVFEYHFLDDQIADFYKKEDLLHKLITASAGIAILVSCLGLLGLISLLTMHRFKEIAIRKVLGASVAQITVLLSQSFVRLVMIAVVIAIPAAWLMMQAWLQNYAYRIHMAWWVFVLAAALALLIAIVTVSFQAIKAALMNPMESLKSE